MTVIATCTNCRDEHDLGEREQSIGTTECPNCEEHSYASEYVPLQISDEQKEQLRSTVIDVDGVGQTVADNIVEVFGSADRVEYDRLLEIDHVGPTVAERITQSVEYP